MPHINSVNEDTNLKDILAAMSSKKQRLYYRITIICIGLSGTKRHPTAFRCMHPAQVQKIRKRNFVFGFYLKPKTSNSMQEKSPIPI